MGVFVGRAWGMIESSGIEVKGAVGMKRGRRTRIGANAEIPSGSDEDKPGAGTEIRRVTGWRLSSRAAAPSVGTRRSVVAGVLPEFLVTRVPGLPAEYWFRQQHAIPLAAFPLAFDNITALDDRADEVVEQGLHT